MKILQANKFYFVKGGAERYYFDLKNLLEYRGHQVIPFSMKNKNNKTSPYEKYFVDNIDIEKAGFTLGDLKSAGRIIYSWGAKRKIIMIRFNHRHIFS